MDSNRTKNASRNIAAGMLNRVLSTLLPFINRTMLLYYLGLNYVGLTNMYASILQILNLTEAGIGSALVYRMYKPIAEENVAEVNALYSFYRKCYRIIGIIVLIVGLAMTPALPVFVKGDMPENVSLYGLYFILLGNTVIRYYFFAFKNSLLVASQRNDVNSNLATVILVVQTVLQCGGLIVFKNYYFYVVVLPAITIATNLIRARIVDKMYPQYSCIGNPEKKLLSGMKKQIVGLFMQRVGYVVLLSADSLVISGFFGLTMLGQYNNYYYIIYAVYEVMTAITTAITPSVGNSVIVKNKKELLEDFNKFTFIFIVICFWLSTCFLCMIQPFIEIWVGADLRFEMGLVVLMAIYLYSLRMNNMASVYCDSAGLWWEGRLVPLVAGIVNIAANLILVRIIGLNGVVISTIVSTVFIYLPGESYVLFKHLFDDKKEWTRYVLRHIYYLICSIICMLSVGWVCSNIVCNSVLMLIIRGIICVLLPIPIFVLLNIKNRSFRPAVDFVKRAIKGLIKRV